MKRALMISVIACLLLLLPFSYTASATGIDTDEDITASILETFEGLASVPRPSHHEEGISEYLKNWAEERGIDVIQDDCCNIIMEVPATEGMEGKPKVVLQGHMDMVFAQKDGAGLDPLTTKINVVNDGTYLKSDGNTSLGADDGIGISIMLNIAEGKMAHGPVRLLMTTDEEDGMTGTSGLDPKYLTDVDYLINIDSEDEGYVCLSTAAGVNEIFHAETATVEPSGDTALQIRLEKLRGGHSGIDIDKGRLNGIVAVGKILKSLDDAGVEYELASFNGGTARNAIPTSASAVICLASGSCDTARSIIGGKADELKREHVDTDPEMTVSVSLCDMPETVVPPEEKAAAVGLITGLLDGINTMSEHVEGLVESSSNLGLASVGKDGMTMATLVRSSSPEELEVVLTGHKALGDELEFSYESEKTTDPWPFNPDNKLIPVVEAAYRSLFGRDIILQYLHAGLECGTYYLYNNSINMIAVGPTIKDPHTVNETLTIDTIERVWSLIGKVLQDIE